LIWSKRLSGTKSTLKQKRRRTRRNKKTK
jgi:hypothetical protein